ncbi:MAG: hypothetical protein EAX96_07495 [Candidatus Lokiarchaeota archaeon]|nr:hypothetical protein [Candidatus Lokiarchaeota archaeon]
MEFNFFRKELFKDILMFLPGLILRIILILVPIEIFLVFYYPDDVFYYWKIAQNLVIGNGFSFDGVTLTNGFQPLWLFIIAPFFIFTNNAIVLARIFGVIQIIFSLISSIFVFKLTKSLTNNKTTTYIASLIFWYSPQLILINLNGMETTLAIMTVILSLYYFQSKMLKDFSYKNVAITGIFVGISILARLDGILLAASMFVYLIIFYKKVNQKNLMDYIKKNIAFIGIIVGIALPFFIISFFYFGTFLPNSAETLMYGINYDLTTILYYILRVFWVQNYVVFILHLIPFLFYYLYKSQSFRKLVIKDLFVQISYLILMIIFYSIILYISRTRYFVVISILFIILFADMTYNICNDAIDLMKRKNLRITQYQYLKQTFILLLCSCSLIGSFFMLYFGTSKSLTVGNSAHLDAYSTAYWLKNNISADERIAGFNVGIIGYFSERTVINLDGVVNNEMVQVYQNKSLMQYILDRNISYLVDSHNMLVNSLSQHSTLNYSNYCSLYHSLSGNIEVWYVNHTI